MKSSTTHPLRRMPRGVNLSATGLILSGSLASAGVLRPVPGAAFQLSATVANCGSNDVCTFDAQTHECGGTKGVFVPHCVDTQSQSTSMVLARDESGQSHWSAGVADAWDTLSVVNAVAADSEQPLLDASVTASRAPNAVTFTFDVSRRPVPSLIDDPVEPVMRASCGSTLAGLCMLGQSDELVATLQFELIGDAVIRLDGALAAQDVRCSGTDWKSKLNWTIASDTDPALAYCDAHATVPDQQLSLQMPRTPAVSASAESHGTMRLAAGNYTITVRFNRGEAVTCATLNACGAMDGAWSTSDTASFTISVAAPCDLDGSGVVDFGDVAFVLLDYGTCSEECASVVAENGEVDFGDVAFMLLDFGTATPQSHICQ